MQSAERGNVMTTILQYSRLSKVVHLVLSYIVPSARVLIKSELAFELRSKFGGDLIFCPSSPQTRPLRENLKRDFISRGIFFKG